MKSKKELDAFYGGYCCCLSAALYGDDGTSPGYLEALAAVGAEELLAYAKRTKDMERKRIANGVRFLRKRERDRQWAANRRARILAAAPHPETTDRE